MKKAKLFLLLALILPMMVSCQKKTKFGIFKISPDKTTIIMDGTINRNSLKKFNKLIEKYGSIKRINIVNCPGSKDDDTNLKLSKRVHDLGIEIHLLDNGEIASGGVDFFLAGVKRTRGSNTKIGVHSWAGGNKDATDYPVGHEEHLKYIEYYKSVGFSQQWSENFYYFTINSAPAKSMHWMTEAEIEEYGMLTN